MIFHFYLDDRLICHHNPDILVEHLKLVLNLATHLGWLFNLSKLSLVPSEQFFHLALDFNTQLALA